MARYRCTTNWVAPGKGATVSEIASILGEIMEDDRRTALAIVRTGEATRYDEERARAALAEIVTGTRQH